MVVWPKTANMRENEPRIIFCFSSKNAEYPHAQFKVLQATVPLPPDGTCKNPPSDYWFRVLIWRPVYKGLVDVDGRAHRPEEVVFCVPTDGLTRDDCIRVSQRWTQVLCGEELGTTMCVIRAVVKFKRMGERAMLRRKHEQEGTLVLLDKYRRLTRPFRTILVTLFGYADLDGDNFFSIVELHAFLTSCNDGEACSRAELQRILTTFDCNPEGDVTMGGFLDMWANLCEQNEARVWRYLRALGAVDRENKPVRASGSQEAALKKNMRRYSVAAETMADSISSRPRGKSQMADSISSRPRDKSQAMRPAAILKEESEEGEDAISPTMEMHRLAAVAAGPRSSPRSSGPRRTRMISMGGVDSSSSDEDESAPAQTARRSPAARQPAPIAAPVVRPAPQRSLLDAVRSMPESSPAPAILAAVPSPAAPAVAVNHEMSQLDAEIEALQTRRKDRALRKAQVATSVVSAFGGSPKASTPGRERVLSRVRERQLSRSLGTSNGAAAALPPMPSTHMDMSLPPPPALDGVIDVASLPPPPPPASMHDSSFVVDLPPPPMVDLPPPLAM